jgi:two-component system repressor protein LuxO
MVPVESARSSIGVMIVDADPVQRRVLADIVTRRTKYRVSAHASGAEAGAAISGDGRHIMIADLDTVGGPEKLAAMVNRRVEMIATSADPSLSTAVAALRGGAVDFIAKPIGAKALLERLIKTVGATEHRESMRDRPELSEEFDFAGFIGQSPVMHATYDQIRRIAGARAPVFITGASGTGKEICARAIHDHHDSGERPFVAINCSAIPSELMESEMFGHIRGAFTGAVGDRKGAAELAHGGTLFLDEIAEMDIGHQAKLLRFLQSGEIRRVGSTQTAKVNVRVICATNRDPVEAVETGRIRPDLFYRLHVLPIHMAPLAERGTDIILLANSFLRRFALEERRRIIGFAPEAHNAMVGYAWPGNVRQLANAIRRMVVLARSDVLSSDLLPADIREQNRATGPGSNRGAHDVAIAPLWRQEKLIISAALDAFDGNVMRAAGALEIAPSTIHRKRQSWKARGDGL